MLPVVARLPIVTALPPRSNTPTFELTSPKTTVAELDNALLAASFNVPFLMFVDPV